MKKILLVIATLLVSSPVSAFNNGDTHATARSEINAKAPGDATYLCQTANSTLSAEQALSSLSSGLMFVTTGTGVVTSVPVSANVLTLLGSTNYAAMTGLPYLTAETNGGLTLAPATVGFTIAGGTTSKTLTVPLDASVSGTNTGDQTNITGNAGTVTVVDSTDATSYIAMFDSATGSLAAKTDTGLTYDATTGMLTATGLTGPLTGTASKATNMVGGNGTTLLGSLPYQSSTDTTTLLAPNTAAALKVLGQTGNGTNGAAPAWATTDGSGDCSTGAVCLGDHTHSQYHLLAGGILSGTHDFGEAVLEIPNGSSVTTSTTGQMALDTNGDTTNISTGVIQVYMGAANKYLFPMDLPLAATQDNYIPKYDAASKTIQWEADATAGSPTFDQVGSGSNTTATMTVGTGGSLAPTGTGTITATALSAPGTSAGGQYISLLEDTDNGTNYTGWGVYGDLAASQIYAPPLAAPTAGQMMVFAVPGTQTMSDGTSKSVSIGSWATPFSTTAIDTSAEIAAIVGDEAGTGALAFATSTPFTTDIHAATAGGATNGTAALPWSDIYFAGTSGTPATNHFKVTGASTSGERVITFPDASIYVAPNPLTTIGDIPYANSTATPAAYGRIAAVAAGQVLASAGTGTAPAYTANPQVTTIELGAATDTTVARVSAGVVSVEGLTLPRIIASGSTALDFASTATGACATVIQAAATNAAATDVIIFNPNASIKAVTGYVPASTGGFSITAFPTTGYVNFEACNWTAGTVDPASITVNWMIIR